MEVAIRAFRMLFLGRRMATSAGQSGERLWIRWQGRCGLLYISPRGNLHAHHNSTYPANYNRGESSWSKTAALEWMRNRFSMYAKDTAISNSTYNNRGWVQEIIAQN